MKKPWIDKFTLERDEDESGISGTGVVAVGVRFNGGKCVLHWLTEYSSVAVYDDIETVRRIHGHGGKTRVVFDHSARAASRTPFGRGATDCYQDRCEGVDGRGLDGACPSWLNKPEHDAEYLTEYVAGYRDGYEAMHGVGTAEVEPDAPAR